MSLFAGLQAIAVAAAMGHQAPAPPTDACVSEVDALFEGSVCTAERPRVELTELLDALRNRPYPEAYEQGSQLLRQPEFVDGASLTTVSAILGRPDLMFVGNRGDEGLYYNTNGGPL